MDIENLPKGIMFQEHDGIFHQWTLSCSCHDPRDDYTFYVEWDKELNGVNLMIEANLLTRYSSSHRSWIWEKFLNFYERTRLALHILIFGYYEVSAGISFKDPDQIANLLSAINFSLEKVKESGRAYGKRKKIF